MSQQRTATARVRLAGQVVVVASVLLLVNAPEVKAAGLWGAMAISPMTGRAGTGYNMSSPGSAANVAIAMCDAYDCRAVITYVNACGAVAQSPINSTWGWAWHDNYIVAQSLATVGCTDAGGIGCLIVGWSCSGY